MLSNILDRLKSWLLGAQEEEVVSQAAPAEFGDNLVVKVEVGSRPTRPSGINVLDVICTMFKKKLAVVVEETIAYPQPRHFTPSESVTALEVPGQLDDDEEDRLLQSLAVCDSENNCLSIRSPSTAASVQVWDNGYFMPAARLMEATCVDLVEIQQYFFSLMNASIESGFSLGKVGGEIKEVSVPVNHDSRGSLKYTLLAYNSALPIGTTPDGYDVYLADAGSDGTTNFGWTSSSQNDPQGQGRSLLLDPDWVKDCAEETSGGILKGMWCGDEIKVKDGMIFKREMFATAQGWDDLESDCLPMIVDINMPKGKGKLMQAVKQAKVSQEPGKVFCMDDYHAWTWFIRVLKEGNEHSQKLATSFQECVFHQGVENDVDDQEISAELVSRLKGEEDVAMKILLQRFCKEQGIDFSNFVHNGLRSVPWRVFKEEAVKDLLRMASSGTFRKKRVLKERANFRLPLHFVVVCDNGAEHSAGDQWRLKQRWARQHGLEHRIDIDREWEKLSMEVRSDIQDPTLKDFAHQRTPTLSPLSLTVSKGMSHTDFISFTKALRNGDELFITSNGMEKSVEFFLTKILETHNFNKEIKDHRGEAVEDRDSMRIRLIECGIALEHAKLDACFFCNPLEGRDRNSDNDGDDTACDPSLYWTSLYRKLEKRWNKMPRFVNELPKSSKMNWSNPKLQVMMTNKEGEDVSENHPKSLSLFKMFPSQEWCTLARTKSMLEVTMTEMQGPTGLGSNVAADLFGRIHWVERDNKLVPRDKTSWKIFKLWVLYCFMVQIFIDWQKRAYELPDLNDWEKLVDEVLNKGGAGLDNMEMCNFADKNSEITISGKKKLQLASNWCYHPGIIYSFAQDQADLLTRPCIWKGKSDGTWVEDQDKILNDLRVNFTESRFLEVNLAAHKADGWLSRYGSVSSFVEKTERMIVREAKAVEEKHHLLSKYVDNGYRTISSATMEAGEDGNLTKLGEVYRGRLFLSGLGFDKAGIELLEDGQAAASLFVGDETLFTPCDLLLVASLGVKGKAVPALKIVLSWYSSVSSLEEWQMKVIELGHRYTLALANVITNIGPNGQLNATRNVNQANYRWWGNRKDVPKIWGNIYRFLSDRCEGWIEYIVEKAFEEYCKEKQLPCENLEELSDEAVEEVIDAVKFALSGLVKISRVSQLLKGWDRKWKIYEEIQDGKARYKSDNYAPIVANEIHELLPPPPQASGNNYRNDDFHLPLLGCSDPIWMAYRFAVKGVPFIAPPRAAKGTAMIYQMMRKHQVLIQSRSLLGGAGWMDKRIFAKVMENCKENQLNVFETHNALRSLCGSKLAGNFVEGRRTRKNFNLNFLFQSSSCINFTENEVDFLEKIIQTGASPLPRSLVFTRGERKYGAHNAKHFIIKQCLMAFALKKCGRLKVSAMASKESAFRYYNALKDCFLEMVEDYKLSVQEGDEKSLYAFSYITLFKDNGDLKDEVEKEKEKIKQRTQKLFAFVNSYKALGL